MEREHDNFGPTLSEHPRSSSRSRRSDRPAESGPITLTSPTPASGANPNSTFPSARLRHSSTSEITAHTALEASAMGRLRILAGSMMALTIVGALVALTFEGDDFTKRLAAGAMAALLLAFGFVWVRAGRPEMDETPMILAIAIPLCMAAAVANFAFGLLSPFGITMAMSILLFASSTTRVVALTAFAVIMTGFVCGAALVRSGLYTRPALVNVVVARQWMWDAGILLVMVLYGAAYAVGRLIRREQTIGVENFERAVREASMRDALLREAREALKNAAGLGAPGRFTDQELDGFRLGPVIGRGGMGEVYKAERIADKREAALKLLRMDALVERTALARFEREARIVASIRSPNVVEVLAVSNADSVLPYIAMERLLGVDLASHLRDCGRMTLLEVADLVSQVATGLSAAHMANVVHRDLKPNNLFRSGTRDRPVWKILDFGVSKWMDSSDASLTAAELVGTPHYMAPEQARGERSLDQCADIYALAAITYRALTGEAPFTGHMPGILRSITDDMPKAPSSAADVPRQIDYVLAIGLAKSREDRFQSTFEFAAAFTMAAGNNLNAGLIKKARLLLKALPYSR
ncbi:MAG TPA: protein kinase [Polyangiales bacterium]